MNNNNKGYSMVELLITLAIMAIVMSGAIVSFTMLNRANVKKAASELDNELTISRMTAMSKVGRRGIEISNNSDGNIVIKHVMFASSGALAVEKVLSEKLLKTAATLKYTKEGETTAEELGASNKFYIMFDKSNGSVLRGAGAYEFSYNSKIVTVSLYMKTGKHNYK